MSFRANLDSSISSANGNNITSAKKPRIHGLIHTDISGLYEAICLHTEQDATTLKNIITVRIQNRSPQALILTNDDEQIIELMNLLKRPIFVIGSNGTIINYDALQNRSGEPIFVYQDVTNRNYGALTLAPNLDIQKVVDSLIQSTLNGQSSSPSSSPNDDKDSPEDVDGLLNGHGLMNNGGVPMHERIDHDEEEDQADDDAAMSPLEQKAIALAKILKTSVVQNFIGKILLLIKVGNYKQAAKDLNDPVNDNEVNNIFPNIAYPLYLLRTFVNQKLAETKKTSRENKQDNAVEMAEMQPPVPQQVQRLLESAANSYSILRAEMAAQQLNVNQLPVYDSINQILQPNPCLVLASAPELYAEIMQQTRNKINGLRIKLEATQRVHIQLIPDNEEQKGEQHNSNSSAIINTTPYDQAIDQLQNDLNYQQQKLSYLEQQQLAAAPLLQPKTLKERLAEQEQKIYDEKVAAAQADYEIVKANREKFETFDAIVSSVEALENTAERRLKRLQRFQQKRSPQNKQIELANLLGIAADISDLDLQGEILKTKTELERLKQNALMYGVLRDQAFFARMESEDQFIKHFPEWTTIPGTSIPFPGLHTIFLTLLRIYLFTDLLFSVYEFSNVNDATNDLTQAFFNRVMPSAYAYLLGSLLVLGDTIWNLSLFVPKHEARQDLISHFENHQLKGYWASQRDNWRQSKFSPKDSFHTLSKLNHNALGGIADFIARIPPSRAKDALPLFLLLYRFSPYVAIPSVMFVVAAAVGYYARSLNGKYDKGKKVMWGQLASLFTRPFYGFTRTDVPGDISRPTLLFVEGVLSSALTRAISLGLFVNDAVRSWSTDAPYLAYTLPSPIQVAWIFTHTMYSRFPGSYGSYFGKQEEIINKHAKELVMREYRTLRATADQNNLIFAGNLNYVAKSNMTSLREAFYIAAFGDLPENIHDYDNLPEENVLEIGKQKLKVRAERDAHAAIAQKSKLISDQNTWKDNYFPGIQDFLVGSLYAVMFGYLTQYVFSRSVDLDDDYATLAKAGIALFVGGLIYSLYQNSARKGLVDTEIVESYAHEATATVESIQVDAEISKALKDTFKAFNLLNDNYAVVLPLDPQVRMQRLQEVIRVPAGMEGDRDQIIHFAQTYDALNEDKNLPEPWKKKTYVAGRGINYWSAASRALFNVTPIAVPLIAMGICSDDYVILFVALLSQVLTGINQNRTYGNDVGDAIMQHAFDWKKWREAQPNNYNPRFMSGNGRNPLDYQLMQDNQVPAANNGNGIALRRRSSDNGL